MMDEVLEYVTKAAGVKVEESTLAAQTIAFMQELSEAAGTLEKMCMAITLPASIVEHYDQRAEELFQQLQKVSGRVEKIYTPVEEDEITKILRRRLFGDLNEQSIKDIVSKFMEYSEKEGILPAGTEPSEYRDRFFASYPFAPEVVDVLYHRWGSFPTFQRTRGVLRLLSLVIHSLKESSKPYIALSDIDLSNSEIRQELLKHVGAEFNSIIAADITDVEAGSKKVDGSLGNAYQGLKLGSRTATTVFLYSFSGGTEQGITQGEIKRCATTLDNPSSVVAESVEQLSNTLFYLQKSGDKYFFSNQPNLNRIRLAKMENVKDSEIVDEEEDLLRESAKGGKFKVFVWEDSSSNIPDSEELKLLILKIEDAEKMKSILDLKGRTPRVYRNTIFFLYPLESERSGFVNSIRRKIADERIETDKSLSLTDDQKKEIKKEIKKVEAGLKESIRRFYRIIVIPVKDGFKTEDLGIPTYGEKKGLTQEVYDRMRIDGEVIERVAPLVIKEKYLPEKDYVLTEQLYQSSLKTAGQTRPINKDVFENGIAEGVLQGLFGLGELKDDEPLCRYFKERASVSLTGNEIIISEDLSKEQKKKEKEKEEEGKKEKEEEKEKKSDKKSKDDKSSTGDGKGKEKKEESKDKQKSKEKITLKFKVPKGKVSNIMGVMNLLHSKFETLEVSLNASDGEISEQDYQDKIEEAFMQAGIEVKNQ